jgi:thioredoxin 1
MASQHISNFEDKSFEEDVLRAGVPVLVDFWAPWCQPCRAIAPFVEQLAEQYAGKVKVGKMNIDDHPSTPQRYNIRGIPTLLLFKDGAVIDQLVGAAHKSRIDDMIKRAL